MRTPTLPMSRSLRTPPAWLNRRRALAIAELALVGIVAALLIVTNPFGDKAAASSPLDNGSLTSLTTVKREEISSQTQVDGTLGYAETWTISAPAGTAPSDVRQAEQGVSTTQAALSAAEVAQAADEQTLAEAEAKLSADQAKEASDCAGSNAAQSSAPAAAGGTQSSAGAGGSASGPSASPNGSPCPSAVQTATSDQAAADQAKPKVSADRAQTESAQTALTQAQQNLNAVETIATGYESAATYTSLPQLGAIVERGQSLYAISGQPTLLLYGSTSAWRAFQPGMSAGQDVGELNANLRALGYGDLSGDTFTSATEQAVLALQQARRMAETGVLPLGSVVFEPEAVRVTTVTPTTGQPVQAGPVMTVSSTRHDVTIELDAANQAQVKVGDRVTITLPSNETTAGVVSKVGKVATTPSSSNNSGGSGSTTPTIEVDVRLVHEAAAGTLDQAPVSVTITTNRVSNALVVPVSALLALSGGGYALESVSSSGVHSLIPVTVGVFDDADGTVQVSGSQIHAGQRVVVPGS